MALLGAAAGYLYLQNEFPEGYLRLLQASEPERRAALPFLLLLAGGMIGLALRVAFFSLGGASVATGRCCGVDRPGDWPWPWRCRW